MNFVKMLIGLPLIIIIAVFAFMNNEMVTLNFWPFYLNITISLSVVIIVLVLLGYIIGKFDSWLSYAPLRTALRSQLKQNKKLSQAQQKLVEKVEDLKGNLESVKTDGSNTQQTSPSVSPIDKAKNKIKSWFKSAPKKDDTWCL